MSALVLMFALSVAAASPVGAGPATAPVTDDVAALQTQFARLPALADVQVRRVGGVLVLEGTITREQDRTLALEVARAQPGVSGVVDRLALDTDLHDRIAAWRQASGERLLRLLSAAPLLLVAAAVAWFFWWLGRRVARSGWGPLGRRLDNPFLASIARQGVGLLFTVAGLLIALQLLDALALAGALVGSAGIAGIAIGFAFRDLAENYIASILLSLRQPFAPDDSVVIDGHEGIVVGLSSRATLLMTPDGNHLRLPNSLVFKAVILNHTRNGLRRFGFDMRLAPDADADIALECGLAALRGVPGVRAEPAPFAQIGDADQEWLRMQYFGWVDQRESNHGWVRSEAIRRVRQALGCAGLAWHRPVAPVAPVEAGPVDAAPPPPPTAAPTAAPISEKQAVHDAVTRARAEMADDLLSHDAPRE